jgi:hypothetical protein
MPRYYFDLRDDIDVDDPEGRFLPDVDCALVHAKREAREMIGACVAAGRQVDLHHSIQVRDEDGEVKVVVHFSEAARIVRAGKPV